MGRRRARRMVFAGMVAVTATACGFLYDPDQLGSSSCTDCDASRNDVRNSAHDGTDTGTDVLSVPEASDGPLPRGCRYLGPATFCRDFDDGNRFDTFFTQWASPGSDLSDSTDSYSPPSALVASIPIGIPGGALRHAYMFRTFNEVVAGGGPTDIRIAANIQLEKYSTGELVPVFGIFFGDSTMSDSRYVVLWLGRDRATVAEVQQNPQVVNEYPFPSDRIPPVGPGAWPRIEVHIAANRPHLWVTLDTGTGPIVVVDRALASPGWSTPRPPELHLGINEMPAVGGAWQVRYDDIVFDLK